MRRGYTKGLRYTIDLTKIADRANPRTVEAPFAGQFTEPTFIEWGDGTTTLVPITQTGEVSHTYPDGTGDNFTVVIRSATGHLPKIAFNQNPAAQSPSLNVSYATVSIDHFAGWLGNNSLANGSCIRTCYNVKYVDPRYLGSPKWNALAYAAGIISSVGSEMALEQPIESFCFDFTALVNASGLFSNCIHLTGNVWPEILATATLSVNFSYIFHRCVNLGGEPFVFWKADGSLDNDKFPSLVAGASAYTGTSEALRAKVPTSYGGTMTV